jgi:hypothetical protein
MEDLTYQAYLANPELRDRIEREVRLARAEAVHRLIVAPLARMFVWMFDRMLHREKQKPLGAIPVSA